MAVLTGGHVSSRCGSVRPTAVVGHTLFSTRRVLCTLLFATWPMFVAGGDGDDECASSNADEGYAKNLHIGAIFVVIVASLAGVAVPLLVQSYSKAVLRTGLFFSCLKLFGAGVILSTGVIHMLLEAVDVRII